MTKRHSSRAVLLTALLVVSLAAIGAAAVAAPAAADHDDEGCEFPVTATDHTGTEVTVEEPPGEVVLIDAASSQTVWEIGAEDRVVGMPVREYTEYLEGSEERTDVLTEDGMSIDVETVVDLEPDLVIAPNFASEEEIEQLRDADLVVYQSPFEESFEDIYAKTEMYGHFLDECDAAAETVDATREEVETVREAVADEEAPRVLYYFFGFTAGEGTFIGDVIETAGGENFGAEAGIQGFQEISDEVVVEEDPEWIVHPDDEGAVDLDAEPLSETTAVETDQVVEVDANLVSQAGPRVVEPLREMAEAFHPEAFEEPEETPTPTPTPEEPADTPVDDEPADADDEPTDADDMVGFGAAVAVIAVLAAALLARRRG